MRSPKKLTASPRSSLLLSFFFCLNVSVLSAGTISFPGGRSFDHPADIIPDSSNKIEKDRSVTFNGGDSAWRSFLKNNLDPQVPIRKNAPAGDYTVMAYFIVSKEGELSDIKALTSHGYGMEEEVVRILQKSPRWLPAIKNGKPVRTICRQPVGFKVKDERNKKGF